MSRSKNVQKNEKTEKISYQNPANTLFGKIVIWTILVAMVGGVIFGLIIALSSL